MKRIFKLFLIALFATLSFSLFFVKDSAPVKADEEITELSPYVKRVGELTERDIYGGVKLYQEKIKSLYNGVDNGITDQMNAKYPWHSNTVQWVDLSPASEDVKIVSWSKGTADGWAAATVRTTAQDFEAKNPGWIVVAAVNGDSFDINGTKEPAKLHVQNGDVYQPYVGYTQIGWEEDNTLHIGGATVSQQMFIDIYNENGEIAEQIPVNAVNTTPSETGVTVLTKDMLTDVDLTGYKVYVGTYEICRLSQYTNQPFVKGTIESVTSELTTTKPNKNTREFYIACKDGSLDNKLPVDTYVRCQYPLTGDWSNVTNVLCGFGGSVEAGAFSAQLLKDGRPLGQGSTDSFANTTHPRTWIGFKEDGSTVLMVCDGRGRDVDYEVGLTYFQQGELMRLAGCTNAFNVDGGGSSTLIVRNQFGQFEVVNRPSDGGERSIGNAVLFVMRDPGLVVDAVNTTRNSVTVKQNTTAFSNQVTNIKATIDGKTCDLVNGTAVIEGLQEDTEYKVDFTYQIPAHYDETKMLDGHFTTTVKTKAFEIPKSGIVIENISKNSFKVVKKPSSVSSWFQDVVIKVGDDTFEMGNLDSIDITNLIAETEYDVEISYKVVEGPTGNEYFSSETKHIKTLSYSIPEIDKFEIYREYTNRVIIQYSYKDADSKVTNANITLNGEATTITSRSGTQTFTDLDLSANLYEAIFTLTYEDESGNEHTVVSESLLFGVVPSATYNITYVLDGGTNPANAPTTYTEGTACALPTPTKAGHSFVGWYSGDTKVESITETTTGDLILTARWSTAPASHTITYNLDGGTNGANAPTTYTEGTTVTLPTPTKEGYTFLGWYSGETKVERITENDKVDFTLTAKWQKNETPDTPTEPETTKKGCKKSMEYLMSFTTLLGLACFLFRKKK